MSVIVWGTFCNPVPNFGLSFYCQGSAACSVFDSFPAVTCQNQTSKLYCTNGYTCGGANFTNDIYIEFPPNDRNAISYDTITRASYNFKQTLAVQSSSGSNTVRRGLEEEVDTHMNRRAASASVTSQEVYNGFMNVFSQPSNPGQMLFTSLANALFTLVSTGVSPTKAALQSDISNSISSAVKSATDTILPLMQKCQEENAMMAGLGPLNTNFFSSLTSMVSRSTLATWLLTMSIGHVIANIALVSDVDTAHSMLGQSSGVICSSSSSKATTSTTAKASSVSTHSSSPTTVHVSSSKLSRSSSSHSSVVLTYSTSTSKSPTSLKSSSIRSSTSKTTSSTTHTASSSKSATSLHSTTTTTTSTISTTKGTSKTPGSLQTTSKPTTSHTTTTKSLSTSSTRLISRTVSSSSVKTASPTATAFSITSCSTALPSTLTSTGFVLTQVVSSSSTTPALTAALYTKTAGASPQLELDSSGVRYLYDNSTPSELFVMSSNFESLRIFQNGSFVYQAANCSYGIRGSLGEPWSSASATSKAATPARRLAERGMTIVDPDFQVRVTIVNQCGKPVSSAKPNLMCQADLPPGAISNFFNGASSPFTPVKADGSGNVYQGTCDFGTGSYILCEAGSFACSSDGQWAVTESVGVTGGCTALGAAAGVAAGAGTLGLSAAIVGSVVAKFCDYTVNKALTKFCDYEYGTGSRSCSISPVSPIVGLNAIQVPGAGSSTTSALSMASQTYGFAGTVTTTVTSVVPAATPNYVSVSDNCMSYSGGLGTSVYCCSGMCLDGTHIGDLGQCSSWLDLCGDLQGGAPSCGANQVLSYGDPATVDSADGCCGACCCECQYQRNNWSWNCCDCPAGYVAVDKGACDGTSSQCVGCPDPSQKLVQAADGTYSCSC